MNFASDNTAGISERILKAINEASTGFAGSYGGDDATRALEARFAEVFETDLTVFPLATGTAANALSIATITPPWRAVLCSENAHIMTDECGAAEMFTGGAKLIGLAGRNAKYSARTLAERLETWPPGAPHHTQPASLSLSQASEFGSVWQPDELAEIGEVARAHGLKVHMDGARFANAVASLQCAPADITWRAGVDILSFGATKNGALAAEAIVVFDKELAASLPFRRMKTGHLLSKGRFLAVQLLAYLEDGHWLKLAGHSNAMATRLAEAIEASPKARLAAPVEANEVFAYLDHTVHEALQTAGADYHEWPMSVPDKEDPPREGEVLARFVASFQTSGQEVGRFAQVIGGL
ncbi:low specificity L-threonine aldolase [Microbaculum marinum]|uniref:L-threonine aldolase n=1 Tax=Microbaculum marinum TaxID=1764581 RepID=A0AAW9RY18_9HYPH